MADIFMYKRPPTIAHYHQNKPYTNMDGSNKRWNRSENLQGKGFALVLAACLLAAAAAGVWAVQTVRGELQKNLDGLRDPASSARTRPRHRRGA